MAGISDPVRVVVCDAGPLIGHRVHGTLGILVRAVRRRLRSPTEVAELLRAIPGRSTLHIRPALLDEIVTEVGGSG